jgi:hypothetical protein
VWHGTLLSIFTWRHFHFRKIKTFGEWVLKVFREPGQFPKVFYITEIEMLSLGFFDLTFGKDFIYPNEEKSCLIKTSKVAKR